jgi:hypothetical protein
MENLERELEDSVETAVAEVAKPAPSLRPVPKQPPSLLDQWDLKERIEAELRQRARRERTAIIAEHDRAWMDASADYDRKLEEATTRIENERRAFLSSLSKRTDERLREHDILVRKMGG